MKVDFNEGPTPLVRTELGGRRVSLKLEYLLPTGSFKDRGSSALVTRLQAQGVWEVVEDSSGNAGSSLAAYCARAGIRCHLYAPADASPGKLEQIRRHGAILHLIKGPRVNAEKAALRAAKKICYASHVRHPAFIEGTSTFAFEVWKQCGKYLPTAILFPTGGGTLILGAFLGFRKLLKAGRINRMPRLVAVQAEKCAPLYEMFRRNLKKPPVILPGPTLAEGIRIAAPFRAGEIVAAVRETGGEILKVPEQAIRSALKVAWRAGFHIEPTSAVALAGFLNGPFRENENILVPLTGNGLKYRAG